MLELTTHSHGTLGLHRRLCCDMPAGCVVEGFSSSSGPGGRKGGNTAARITTQVLYYSIVPAHAFAYVRRMQTSDANLPHLR